MEWIEITAATMSEAKDRALDALGVDERDAEFEILEEPKSGLFGRTKGEARIRARVAPRKPRSKNRREPARRTSRDKGERSGRGSERGSESRAKTDSRTGNGNRERTPRPSRERTGPTQRKEHRVPQEREGGYTPREEVVVALDEQSRIATDFLSGFAEAVGLQAKVESAINNEDEILELNLNGEDLGILIGPRGQTMTALQEFIRIVVQRKTGATNGRILLDVAGYRGRRKEALSKFATEIAAEVKETGVAKVLEPMNPADRKIVHDTVNDIDGVETASEGVEPRRRVVINPTSASAGDVDS